MRGLVRISTGKAIQRRAPGHSVNCQTLKTEKLLCSSPSQIVRCPESTGKHFRSEIRNKSGNTLKTLSEQILNFQVSYVGRSQTLENKAHSVPRYVSELCCPQYGWYRFFFWRGPLHERIRAGHEILNSTGEASEKKSGVAINGQGSVLLFLEDRNLLKLRSLGSSCPFFLSDNSIWGQ